MTSGAEFCRLGEAGLTQEYWMYCKENRQDMAAKGPPIGRFDIFQTGPRGIMMRIIQYEDKYRDDMIFMVLEAKNALGRVPRLNEDLLDVPGHYLSCGDMFWVAVNDDNRVVGCIGYNKYNHDTAKLHRLYVKYSMKRQGIGTELLKTAEQCMKEAGYRYSIVHLGGKEYFESRQFYPKHGYREYKSDYMLKEL